MLVEDDFRCVLTPKAMVRLWKSLIQLPKWMGADEDRVVDEMNSREGIILNLI